MKAIVGAMVAAVVLVSGTRTVCAQTEPNAAERPRSVADADISDLEPAHLTPADLKPADLEPAVSFAATTRPAAGRRETMQGSSRPAVDSLDLGTTSVTGNQELPKVLYIVPWKRSDLGDVVGRPVNTLLDEVLAPIDPEVFERSLSYYGNGHSPKE
jgi:hypothetical protein